MVKRIEVQRIEVTVEQVDCYETMKFVELLDTLRTGDSFLNQNWQLWDETPSTYLHSLSKTDEI